VTKAERLRNARPAIAPAAASPLVGVALLVAAVGLFACMDVTTKYLATAYNVPLVVALRYIVNVALMLVLLAPREGRQLIETRRTALVLVRAGCLALASLFVGLALRRMPVAETTSIVFLAPMLVVIAAPVLGERVSRTGWVAAILGFAGVLLIVRPGGGLAPAGIAFALAGVAATVGYLMLSRVLAASERTVTLLFYTALVGAVAFGLLLPWSWHGPAPTGAQAALFVGIGAMGGLGHYLFTAAFRHAPASVLAPIGYVQLFWAGLLGWLVFGHVPDGPSILGMAVVVGCGAMIALQSRRGQGR
jgi:drug/metabolite transporter (DMT)-like permease